MSCGVGGAIIGPALCWVKTKVCRKACAKSCGTCSPCHVCIRPQRADSCDLLWEPHMELPDPAPERFRLSNMPPAPDQRNISACAVNACATALNYGMTRYGMPEFRASRLFLYYNTRRYVMRLPDLGCDSGCSFRDVCKAAVKYGACEEVLWPYSKQLLGSEPPLHLYSAARRMPRFSYRRVPQSLAHMVACLLDQNPIMMGMNVYSNIAAVKKSGVMPMPGPDDTQLGAHAVLVCGYDAAAGRFIVQNCWGMAWGSGGFFEVPMAFALDPAHCWDLWVLTVRQ